MPKPSKTHIIKVDIQPSPFLHSYIPYLNLALTLTPYLYVTTAAKKCHPDLNPNDSAAKARFQRLAAAYEVLSDPARRKNYDSTGQTSTQQQGYQQQSRPGAGTGARAGQQQYQYVYEEDPSKHAEQVFRGVFEVGDSDSPKIGRISAACHTSFTTAFIPLYSLKTLLASDALLTHPLTYPLTTGHEHCG